MNWQYIATKPTSCYSMRQTSQYRNNWMKLLQVIWLSKESNHFSIWVFCIFNKIKYRVRNKLTRELYHAFIYSRMKYGIEVNGNCSDKNINTIQVTQNKLLKLILHNDRITPTDEIHKIMNILKVKNICESMNAIYFHLSIMSWWKCVLDP